MKEIPLSRGYVALVDDADFEWLKQWKWYASSSQKKIYARRTVHVGKVFKGVVMHRVIMAASDAREVDHRDGNGLNNQRSNLRLATKWQNGANRGAPKTNKSGFKGVFWHRKERKWRAQIIVRGMQMHLGTFSSPEVAHAAYIKAAKKYCGEFAYGD